MTLSIVFLVFISGSVSAIQEGTFEPQWLDAQFKELVSEDYDRIYASVKCLTESGHPEYYDFLSNLFNGSVFFYSNISAHYGLVIGGDPITDEDLNEWVPLFSVFPEVHPLKEGNGKAIRADIFDLVEIETDRNIRLLIQKYLTRCELTSDDPKKRKHAISSLVINGDRSVVSMLQELVKIEKSQYFVKLLEEAINQLNLSAEQPLLRYLAAKHLGDNRCVNSINTLTERITTDAQGHYPETTPEVREAISESISILEFRVKTAEFIQVLFSGLSLGSILILMAMGLAIIYGLVGVINMAHGEFMMIGAYTTFLIQSLFMKYVSVESVDYFFLVSMPLSFMVAGSLGVIVEKIVIRHLYNRPLESLLATWGISLLFIQSARVIFGDLTAVRTPAFLSGGLEILSPVVFPYNRIFIMIITALMAVSMYLLFYRSRIGTKIRAVTQNRHMSECLGIHTRRIDTFSFFIGTGIAGLAGCCLTLIGNVVPNMGQTYIVDSFLVVVTGGVGKIAGMFFSGFSIGFCNKLLEPLLEAVYAKVAILALVILFLQLKPTGLFPAKGRVENE